MAQNIQDFSSTTKTQLNKTNQQRQTLLSRKELLFWWWKMAKWPDNHWTFLEESPLFSNMATNMRQGLHKRHIRFTCNKQMILLSMTICSFEILTMQKTFWTYVLFPLDPRKKEEQIDQESAGQCGRHLLGVFDLDLPGFPQPGASRWHISFRPAIMNFSVYSSHKLPIFNFYQISCFKAP